MDQQTAKAVPTRLDAWKRQQPKHHDVSTWAVPKTGGRVLRASGRLYYRSTCWTCRNPFLVVRVASDNVMGSGKWHQDCSGCERAKSRAHDAGAKERMRKHRAKLKAQEQKSTLRRRRPTT
ncbi:hypothetical protein SAVIM338S_02268 [Streptomyces avidinii]